MTTPADLPIEDRVRAHLDEVADMVELLGPENDTMLARARDGLTMVGAAGDASGREGGHPGWRRGPLLAAAAAVVAVLAIVAGVAVVRDGGGSDVRTDPTPAPTRPTPDVAPSTTVPPSTETTAGTTTSTSVPAPAGAVPTGPIVGPEGILGSWDGAAWVEWNIDDPAPPDQEYQVVTLGERVRTAVGTEAVDCTPAGRPSVDVGFDYGYETGTRRLGLAVAHAPDLLPRDVEALDPSAGSYQQAAAEVAADLGIADDAPEVRQVVRADLDGRGVGEVLVVAGRGSVETGQAMAGDWEVLFQLRVLAGGIETTVIRWDQLDGSPEAQPPAIQHYEVTAVADVNGDGPLEVAVHERFWENAHTDLLTVQRDGSMTVVLSAWCGA